MPDDNKCELPDILKDEFEGIPLDFVGITDLTLPCVVATKEGKPQNVTATFELCVAIEKNVRGAHLSRLVQACQEISTLGDIDGIRDVLIRVLDMPGAVKADFVLGTILFRNVTSPVSHIPSKLGYHCSFKMTVYKAGDYYTSTRTSIEIPITTCCPCSKSISTEGAHNQRAKLNVSIEDTIWFEAIIDAVQNCGSSRIYPVLKREDEKFVTEQAIGNPKFVEDVCRDAMAALRPLVRFNVVIDVCVKSYESIHNHNAFARTKQPGTLQGDPK